MPTSSVAFALGAFLVAFLVPYVGTALWVRRDARRRGRERATAWVVVVLLAGPLFPAVLVAYALARPNAGGEAPPERLDRVLRNVVAASVLSFLVVGVASPPDPITQAYAIAVALPALVLLAVLVAYRDVLLAPR